MELAEAAVLVKSEQLPSDTPIVKGYDFNEGIDYDKLLQACMHTGFQATSFALAVQQINQMLYWRLSDVPVTSEESEEEKSFEYRSSVKCKIFLGYTSNMISCGIRETIRFLVQHKLVDAIVTTAGGVEEDLMKCIAPHFMGDFSLKGRDLRRKGINRIGNLLVPNDNYCKFEDWITPILDKLVKEQSEEHIIWTPSRIIERLGKEINNEESVYYWAYRNNIPVFCPGLTDGSIGDMIFFHSYKHETKLVIDIAGDIRNINNIALKAKKTGMVIIGGGIVKHHICNANLMRNGADFSVFINTAQEYDGSDAGAHPEEAISWGKIKIDAKPVKLYAEAALVFPLIVAQTFARYHFNNKPANI